MDPVLLIAFAALAGLMIFNGRSRKKQAALLAQQVVVGARVMLSSGVVGIIKSIDEKTLVIESAGSKLEVVRSAVVRVDSVPTKLEEVPAKSAAKPAAAKSAAKPAATKSAAKPAAKPAAKKPTTKPAAK
jgi:preprotein translocase subunit YajC